MILRHRGLRTEALTVAGGDVLPIFSFGEEAAMFLRLDKFGVGWQTEATTPAELASMLSRGPCAGVGMVALDPPPEVCGSAWLDLVSLDKAEFLRTLGSEARTLARANREPGPLPVA